MTVHSSRRHLRSFGLAFALVLVLAGCDWPMIGFNATHSGYNQFESTIGVGNVAGLHQVWSATTPDSIVSAPAIAGNVAYVGTRDNKLYAFSADGTTGCSGTPKTCSPLWSTPGLGGDVVASPAVANGMVYVASVGAQMVAFDAAGQTNCSGAPKVCHAMWSRTMSGDVIAPLTVAGGVVYVIAAHDFSEEVDALDGTTGALRWSALVGDDIHAFYHTTSAVTIANGVAYAGFNDGAPFAMVAAFDAKGVTGCTGSPPTCQPLWTTPNGNALRKSTPVFGSASIFASSDFGGLSAFDPAGATGCSGMPKECAPLWSADAPLVTPTVANGIVFDGNDAFDATGTTGCSGSPKTCDPLWTNASGTVGAVANGVAYSTSSTAVTGYDAAGSSGCTTTTTTTCAALWTASVSNPTSPVVINGALWIGSTDHSLHVYALSP